MMMWINNVCEDIKIIEKNFLWPVLHPNVGIRQIGILRKPLSLFVTKRQEKHFDGGLKCGKF